jgi:hypothetical protein
MTLDEETDQYEPDDDWYDDDREPDPEDAEIARSYAEYHEHCDQAHGGGECDCRPSALDRLRWAAGCSLRNAWAKVRIFAREVHTIRVGPLELAACFRPPLRCGACGGEGWFYSRTGLNPRPVPEGYDGVSLCGCGSAIARLAEARRYVRQAQDEPPF